MAQAGYTPIQIYYSTTTTNTPSAGNLADGELAINTADGKLFYKDNLGAVQVIATQATAALAIPVTVPNGGTGITSGTSGGVPYFSGTTTIASSAALAANAIVIGGGAGVAPSTTPTGSGVLTAAGNAVNTTNGLVTQTATLTSSALLLGGGSGTGIASTTTGTGVVTALGNNANATGGFTTINGTATLTNKRIDPRVSSTASTASITPDISAFDQYAVTAQAAALAINAPTGTPVDGNRLIFRLLDNGTARALTWDATYTAIGVTLPTTTVVNKTTYVGCIYNANNTRWDVVAVTTQA